MWPAREPSKLGTGSRDRKCVIEIKAVYTLPPSPAWLCPLQQPLTQRQAHLIGQEDATRAVHKAVVLVPDWSCDAWNRGMEA